MLTHVVARRKSGTRGALRAGGNYMSCALGRGGIKIAKREGDGATPAGIWPFRRVFFRADRLMRPKTGLTTHALAPHLGWCDDPASAAYNQLIQRPITASHEAMWRDDHLYDIVIELGYNDQPVIPRRGSAIFLHLAKDNFAPTEGCIAVRRDDMLRLLTQIQSGDAVSIQV